MLDFDYLFTGSELKVDGESYCILKQYTWINAEKQPVTAALCISSEERIKKLDEFFEVTPKLFIKVGSVK